MPKEYKTAPYKEEMERTVYGWDRDDFSLGFYSESDYIYAYGFANDLEPNAPSTFSAYAYDNGCNPVGVPGFGGFAMYIH